MTTSILINLAYSTQIALIQISDSITKYLDLKETTAVSLICCDFSKAFDTVAHQKLLKKMSAFLPSNILQWFKSYLNDRLQKTIIKGHTSDSIKEVFFHRHSLIYILMIFLTPMASHLNMQMTHQSFFTILRIKLNQI